MPIYQIVVRGLLQGSGALRNIHHYLYDGDPLTQTEMQAVINVVDQDYKDNLQSFFSPEVLMGTYGIRRVDLGDQPEAVLQATAGTWVGTSTLDQMPEQLAAIVTFRAFSAYPRTTRSYMFPSTEYNNTVTGGILSGALTALTAWANDMAVLTVAAVGDLQKVAVRFGGTPRAVEAYNIVTSFAVAGRWRSQRRRRLGVGA